MRIAAVTMVWNEAERLPRWLAWYGAQLGLENLHVVDDGGDDGSVEGLGPVQVLRRSGRAGFDETERAAWISAHVARLLERYDAVVYTDVDEFIVPADASPLAAAIAGAGPATVTPVAFDVLHDRAREPALDPDRPILGQRGLLRFNPTYCKPLVTRAPVRWRPGFHFSDRPLAFAGLVLFHTRHADAGLGLRRLAQYRRLRGAREGESTHWQARDADFLAPLDAADRATPGPLTADELALWEDRLTGRLKDSPRNVVALIRDLPDLHPSYYRTPARFSGVG